MTSPPSICICTCASLPDQPALNPVLEILVLGGDSRSLAAGRPAGQEIVDRSKWG